jgi:hypothetical protein
MTNKKISELTAATTVSSADLLPVVDIIAGETKQATMLQVATSASELSEGTQVPIPMAISSGTDLNTYVVLGAYSLDPAGYNSIEFVTVASVTGPGLTGNIQLWNVTDVSEVVVNDYLGILSPAKVSVAVSLPAGEKTYEVRHRVTGGSTSADRITTAWAGLVGSAKPNVLITTALAG